MELTRSTNLADEEEEEEFLKKSRPQFKDKDYEDANKTLNRVKQFTFVGGSNKWRLILID